VSRRIPIAALVLALAGTAAGERRIVVRGPELAVTCPNAPSWNALTACITQHGWTMKVARTVGRGTVLELGVSTTGAVAGPAVALYVQQADRHWRLAGLFEPGGTDAYEVLDVQPLTIAHTSGFRVDVGVRSATELSFDGVTRHAALTMMTHVLLCGGMTYACSDLVTTCDAVVDGHLYSTFHGALVLDAREARVEGDATLAQPGCAGAEAAPLRWQ
jgi:hypothetical protein